MSVFILPYKFDYSQFPIFFAKENKHSRRPSAPNYMVL